MSTTPVLPGNAKEQLKSFWKRPEGKTGMLVLAGLGGLAIWGWGSIVGFLVSMMVDTLHLAGLVAIFVGIVWLLTSKRSHLLFRLLMRWLTGLLITIDPIGILKDHVQQMKKKDTEFQQQIAAVSGQIRILKDTITRNAQDGLRSMKEAEFAKKQSAQAKDSNARLRMELQMRSNAAHAGRLKDQNIGYQALLDRTQKVYDLLTKWDIHIQFLIEDTEDQVKQAEVQYKTVNAAYGALQRASAIIKGNVDENEIYNETLEHLAEDAGRKLGEIDDFQRVAQNFMDKIDVQNGAAEQDALDALDQYEQKVLTSGSADTAFLLPGTSQTGQTVPISRQTAATGTGGYDDFLKK